MYMQIYDSALLGEAAIPAIRDALDRLMIKENAIVIPQGTQNVCRSR
jgi:predicted RNA methylase